MALSKIGIRFNVDLVDTNSFSFELYNTDTTSTTTYTYTCVDGIRAINEFTEADPFINAGDATASSFQTAVFEDYGTSIWTIERTQSNEISLTTVNENVVFQNPTSASNVGFNITSIPVPEIKKSYYFEFTDLVGIEHRVDIDWYNDNTNKEEIKGNYTIENASNDDILAPLRPKQATINLDASSDLTFSDLYSEEEKTYKITIKRDNKIIFVGWLSSDGLYENFVSDKWQISLNAIDGLGYLEDISYTNIDGVLYSGKQTDIEKLAIILGKTDLDLGFRTSINIYYDGLSGVDILNNTYFNAERYYTEDNNEPFNCNDMLLSVLEKYNAVITQKNGYWYIYRPNEIYDSANVTFYNYDKDGVLVVDENTVTEDLTFNLGSQLDDFYPHHVNSNQQKSLQRSLGAYRVNLKFGRVFPYFQNTFLNWTDASNIDEWTIVEPTLITPYDSLQGFRVIDNGSTGAVIVANSDDYTVTDNPRIQFQTTFSNLNDTKPTLGNGGASFLCKIIYTKGVNTYYLTKDGFWVTSDDLIVHSINRAEKNFTLKIVARDNLPESDGVLRIDLYDAGFGLNSYALAIHNISLQTYNGQEEQQGNFYTIEKVGSNVTPNTTDVKKVIHGDVPDETYYSTIYENDQTTTTEFWYRKNYEESKNLLQIMVEDRIRMNYNPKIIFEGDVYGYIPFLSRINVNNVKDKMMCLEWSYDAFANITTIKLIELLNYDFQSIDVIYSLTPDYGETTKPTITS